jgi:hypothetical protein
MPRGDKSAYTDKQKCQVKHIEEGYEKKVFPRMRQSGALGLPRISCPGAEKNQGRARSLRNIEQRFLCRLVLFSGPG